jgi:hypothetical protein
MTYRRIRIGQLGGSKTITYAVQELVSYLKKMDTKLVVDILQTDKVRQEFDKIIWVGLDDALADKVPHVENAHMDDAIAVDVKEGSGFITGSNERSVLLAVYQFLKSLGCAWVRPGQEGERIPKKEIDHVNVRICEVASYRHRGVCIEGADTYENILDMIDYLPKVGMNAYFMQFMVPGVFFTRWYEHLENPYLEKEDISRAEIEAMVTALEAEIGKRGLCYHKTGHGWTCEPFGIDGTSWDSEKTYLVSEETKHYLAQVDGQRELWKNVPLNTNLCYSNPTVRDKMTDAITEYCKKNQHVDMLHVWLADGENNHCECEECIKKRPADWYVKLLNELDEKLTAADVDTKIVFLIYVDLLWEPLEERLQNPDRFILMFAPITRNFGQNYGDYLVYDGDLPPYVRNELDMPDSLAQNLEQLRHWQRQFEGDSFVFDYHLMWAHVNDPGYEYCARNVFEDMKDLRKIGLNGMVSCQVHRCFFPTALPFNMMAAALWNEDCDYEEKASAYYIEAFGEDGLLLREYLKQVSELFLLYEGPARGAKVRVEGQLCKDYEALEKVIDEFTPVIHRNMEQEEWRFIQLHKEYMVSLMKVLKCLEEGRREEARTSLDALLDMLYQNEIELQKVMDARNMKNQWIRRLKLK